MVGMARRAVPACVAAGGTNLRATLAIARAVPQPARFPPDFMFQVTAWRSQFATLKRGQKIKYLPYAFTENGAISRGTDQCDGKRRGNGNGRKKFHQQNAYAISEKL